jgi:hypothetical protein
MNEILIVAGGSGPCCVSVRLASRGSIRAIASFIDININTGTKNKNKKAPTPVCATVAAEKGWGRWSRAAAN